MPRPTAPFDQAAFEAHLARGHRLLSKRAFDSACDAFEQAHLLGQHWTAPHTRSHALSRCTLGRGHGRGVPGLISTTISVTTVSGATKPSIAAENGCAALCCCACSTSQAT